VNQHEFLYYITIFIAISLWGVMFWFLEKSFQKKITKKEFISNRNHRKRQERDFLNQHDDFYPEIEEILNLKNITKEDEDGNL